MAQLKILISGGGIAGNALAFWLSKLGYNVTVVERFPGLRTTGLQIDLRGHGIDVLKRMGLENEFRSRSAPEQGMQVVDSSGRRWAYFPVNKSGKGLQSFTTEFEIMRGDLCQLLYDACKNRVQYIFGCSVESFSEKDNSVQVRFTDGKIEEFDLLVGADGQWSRTRRLMFGSNSTTNGFHALPSQFIGYFTFSKPMKQGEEFIATSYVAPGGRAILTRRHTPHQIQVYLSSRASSEKLLGVQRGDVAQEKAAFLDVFQGAGWETEAILQGLREADDFYCERLGVVKLETWSQGCVALLGDAAYCPSANTGMGTTSAIVGAYILAGEIGRQFGHWDDGEKLNGVSSTRDALATALKKYDERFRPFMDQVQKGVLDDKGMWDLFSTSFGIFLLNIILGLASFFKVNILGRFILHEEILGWDLPEYKEVFEDRNI
jgi:2-polyprenyl-6-methoxyphenol hydroxylase-like FAD-dependent oxidoreductase